MSIIDIEREVIVSMKNDYNNDKQSDREPGDREPDQSKSEWVPKKPGPVKNEGNSILTGSQSLSTLFTCEKVEDLAPIDNNVSLKLSYIN